MFRRVVAPSNLLLGAHSYVDTARIWLPRYLRSEERRRLLKASPRSFVVSGPLQFHPFWKCCIVLQHPMEQLLENEEWAYESALVSRLDIALDLTTSDQAAARNLQQFFDSHQTKSWRGKQRQGRCEGTTYSSGWPQVAIQLVRYSDRPSKVTGTRCLHLEWRMQRRETVKSARVLSPLDILTINHYAFWRRRIRLWQLDVEKLKDQVGQREASTAVSMSREIGGIQGLLDNCKERIKPSLVPIRTEWMIKDLKID